MNSPTDKPEVRVEVSRYWLEMAMEACESFGHSNTANNLRAALELPSPQPSSDEADARRYRLCKEHGFPKFHPPRRMGFTTDQGTSPAWWAMAIEDSMYRGDTAEEAIDAAITAEAKP